MLRVGWSCPGLWRFWVQRSVVSSAPHSTIPPRVDYDLTDLGRRIAERICDLIEAIYDQLPGIVAHQRDRGTKR